MPRRVTLEWLAVTASVGSAGRGSRLHGIRRLVGHGLAPGPAGAAAAPAATATGLGDRLGLGALQVPDLADGVEHHLDRLGAADAELLVEHEGGHRGDADLRGEREVGAHVDAVVVAGEQVAHGGLVEAALDTEPHERLRVADGLALGVPGAHDPRGDLVLTAEGAGEVDQPVRVVGVAAAQRAPLEVEPDRGGVDRHPLVLRDHLLAGDAVLLGDPVDRRGVVDGWCGAVELEAVPDDPHLVAVLELLEGELEVPPAEVAERAEDVGPDVDAHVTRVSREPPCDRTWVDSADGDVVPVCVRPGARPPRTAGCDAPTASTGPPSQAGWLRRVRASRGGRRGRSAGPR